MIPVITRFIHFCSLHSEAVPRTSSLLEELSIRPRPDADFNIAAWLFWKPDQDPPRDGYQVWNQEDPRSTRCICMDIHMYMICIYIYICIYVDVDVYVYPLYSIVILPHQLSLAVSFLGKHRIQVPHSGITNVGLDPDSGLLLLVHLPSDGKGSGRGDRGGDSGC